MKRAIWLGLLMALLSTLPALADQFTFDLKNNASPTPTAPFGTVILKDNGGGSVSFDVLLENTSWYFLQEGFGFNSSGLGLNSPDVTIDDQTTNNFWQTTLPASQTFDGFGDFDWQVQGSPNSNPDQPYERMFTINHTGLTISDFIDTSGEEFHVASRIQAGTSSPFISTDTPLGTMLPEPGTLVLIGSACALLARRISRSRH